MADRTGRQSQANRHHSPARTFARIFRTAGMQARQRVLRDSTWERYGQSFSVSFAECWHHQWMNLEQIVWHRRWISRNKEFKWWSLLLNRGSYLIDTLHDFTRGTGRLDSGCGPVQRRGPGTHGPGFTISRT